MKSLKIADGLYLNIVNQSSGAKPESKPVSVPVNHIFVIDASGSMYMDLPLIRDQFKRKLPMMLGETDTVSIIWFSSRGSFGVVLEGEKVRGLADLSKVNQAIDRWLHPVAMTGFYDPLIEVKKLVGRIQAKSPGVNSLFFLTDGHDNQSSQSEILSAMTEAASAVQATTIVEYGYYAGRELLAKMAEKAGGSLIFSRDFHEYDPIFEQVLKNKPSSQKKIEQKINGDVVGGFVFTVSNDSIATFSVEGGKTVVPEGSTYFYLSPEKLESTVQSLEDVINPKSPDEVAAKATYAAISLFSVRSQPNVVYPLLKATGDVSLITEFGGCFGKQKYSDFMDRSKEAAFDAKKRLRLGWDPKSVPPDDAFTVLDLLRILSDDPDNKIMIDHPDFSYSRIGRASLDAQEMLSADERLEIEKLTEEMNKTKDSKKVKELSSRIAAISNKPDKLVFEQTPVDGYAIDNLVYNEERPNVSIRVRKEGKVNVSSRTPDEFKKTIPENINTFIFRNYTVIKDGILNLELLPVKVTNKTAKALSNVLPDSVKSKNIVTAGKFKEMTLNLKGLPIVNRNMVSEVSAKELFQLEWDLAEARANQKVYKHYLNTMFESKKALGFEDEYGKSESLWLKEQCGITAHSGFSPKVTRAEAKDFYLSRELNVSIKGYSSSLPSVEKALDAIKSGKVNGMVSLMSPAINQVESAIKSHGSDKEALQKWLIKQSVESVQKTRELLFEKAKIVFTVVVGQVWFKEFKSVNENTLSMNFNGKDVECKVEMAEKQIEI